MFDAPPSELSIWWNSGAYYTAEMVAAAGAACVVAAVAGRKFVPLRPDETERRRFVRDVAAFTFAIACSLLAIGAGAYHVFTAHTHIKVFMAPAAIAFYLCGFWLPSWIALRALGKGDRARAACAIAIVGLSSWMQFVEPNRLDVHRDTLTLPSLPKGSSIRIAHISDVQTVMFGGREQAAADAINAFDPDVVVFTGDLIASDPHPVLVERARRWLAALKSRTTRFAVNGDCDGDFDGLMSGIPGVTYLKDSGTLLEVNGAKIWFGGLDNHQRPPDPYPCMKDAPPGATRIFLTHNPEFCVAQRWERTWHAELALAGHTHGGQIQIPFYGAPVTLCLLGRRYSDGVFRGEDLVSDWRWHVDQLVVCAGLGMEGGYAPRVRFLRPPQVMLLTLTN